VPQPTETRKPFYLTTPIYYVNARPHIGHAYSTIAADVLARRHRLLGHDTYFLTGTDEHGQKIERSAAAAGIPPQQFADQVSKTFSDLWARMGITHNQFIRTTSDPHKLGVQKLFTTLYENGHIYLASYTGSYCVSDEAFIDAPVGTPCPDCGRLLEEVTEENFFFKLSEFQLPLLNLIESNELLITPDSSRNEVLSFLRGDVKSILERTANLPRIVAEYDPAKGPELRQYEDDGWAPVRWGVSAGLLNVTAVGTPYLPGALKDLSISRSSFTWGIPVPPAIQAKEKTAQPHVIYVWLDALANYMTALGYGAVNEDGTPAPTPLFDKFWPADLHLVGKEITRFHCVYWPAFLLAAGLPTPKQITANGWLLFDNSKMSKSKGNIVRTETILDAFGTLCPPPPVPNSVILSEGAEPHPAPQSKDLHDLGPATSANPLSTTQPAPGPPNPADSTNPSSTASLAPAADSTNRNSTASLAPPADSTNPSSTASLAPAADSTNPNSTASLAPAAESTNPSSTASLAPPTESANRRGTASAVPSDTSEQGALAPEVGLATPTDRDLFAADILRYYLLREIPFGQDGSFSFDALITRYNADLANGYGNLVSRVLAMVARYYNGAIPTPQFSPNEAQEIAADGFDAGLLGHAANALQRRIQALPPTDFTTILTEVAAFITTVDGFISSSAPWKLAKQLAKDPAAAPRLATVLYQSTEAIRWITGILHPFCPYITGIVWAQLGLGNIADAARDGELAHMHWAGLKPETQLGPLGPIFPRAPKELAQIMIDKEMNAAGNTPNPPSSDLNSSSLSPLQSPPTTAPDAPPRTASLNEPTSNLPVAGSQALTTGPDPAPLASPHLASLDSPQITIDDFAKIDLRVAQIVLAERIPKADKLLRLEVDLGPLGTRQILSGIAEFYTPEELTGRRIVVIANLAPRKMRGLESHGMLLAASDGDHGKPHLATCGEDIPLGARLK
jgi:methionine--tRNA ligase beta chain